MKPMKWIAAGVFSLLGALPATAQDFPSRVITMVVPFAAGGPGRYHRTAGRRAR